MTPTINISSLPIIAFAMLSAASPTNAGESWLDRCVAVIDGDTIVVARGTDRVEVDLEGADCPEFGQPFGEEAKRFTAGKVCRKIVNVQVKGGGDGRVIGRVTVFGKDLSLELVKAGLAWHDRRESHSLRISATWLPSSRDFAPDQSHLAISSAKRCRAPLGHHYDGHGGHPQ